jgi:hypothetical protein
VARETLRALVIGDPDPDHPLPIARSEAVAVAKALSARRMEVHLCIGAPDANGRGTFSHPETSRFVAPADLFRIIARLQGGCYDLVHFAGHGTFSADTPELSGWLFAGNEVLTPAMLENTENAPALIFANACLSGALAHDPRDTSADAAGAERRRRWRGEAQLVASLADEFLRRGVADYIGTAWPVPDALASEFATTFYQTLLDSSEMTLGGAMQKARAQIHAKRDGNAHRESAWAAYQHYGDPTRRLNATGTGA